MMKQLKVSLPDGLRAQLDTAAASAGQSVAEEIRQRLEQSFEQDEIDQHTRQFMAAIANLVVLVRLQTGHDWHSHPAANRVLRNAITARLARLRPSGEPVFAPGELPSALLVASDDPEAMGLGLEAINFHTPPVDKARLQEMEKETMAELQRRHSKGKGS
jgi:hypothetical protein